MLKLHELLDYYDWDQEQADTIQIVTPERDWDDADEVHINSELLIPFYFWMVTDFRCEMSFLGKKPVLRVLIEPLQDQSQAKPSRNAGFSSFFNFLPYKTPEHCAKIERVVEMVEWLWIPVALVVGLYIGIMLIAIFSANDRE